jgi:hypothetical protein
VRSVNSRYRQRSRSPSIVLMSRVGLCRDSLSLCTNATRYTGGSGTGSWTAAAGISRVQPRYGEKGLSRHRCGQVLGFRPWDRVSREARQTFTTLEAIRPDRAWRPYARAALHRDPIGRDLPGSGSVPSRQGRRCAARCARPFRPSLTAGPAPLSGNERRPRGRPACQDIHLCSSVDSWATCKARSRHEDPAQEHNRALTVTTSMPGDPEIANHHPLAKAWRAFEHALDDKIKQAAIAT